MPTPPGPTDPQPVEADPGTAYAPLRVPACLRYASGGFLTDRGLRRFLSLAGHDLRFGKPHDGDGVVVWGDSPSSARGAALAGRHRVPLVRVEDAFLRSVHPGRAGDPPVGLILDPMGVHFDSSTPSLIEHILAHHPLSDDVLLTRARDGMARMQIGHLSKYNAHDPTLSGPEPGYVLVIDQSQGDAAIRLGGASARTFRDMLAAALADHPDARIVIKSHPDTMTGHRAGHFGPRDATGRVSLIDTAVSPLTLLRGASAVYTVSSQMGFEAILAGHRPQVFGQPFYAGWGLTQDRQPVARRTRVLSSDQMFAAAMIVAPVWRDPCLNTLCSFETALDQMEATVSAFRLDRAGHVALRMRLWKRPRLQAMFGGVKPVLFDDDPARAKARATGQGRGLLVWAGRMPAKLQDSAVIRVEDGFLRSRGLGAALTPPLSLIADPVGIYYDPTRPSAFEALMQAPLPPGGVARAERLRRAVIAGRATKYNLKASVLPKLPKGQCILVVGQVADDASVILGATGTVRTNLGLLQAARAANPGAVLIYKPHPDVEAGLREGAVAAQDLANLADVVATKADTVALLAHVAEVWTITSLLGFEALVRGVPVTCLGAPFYAGWGLTTDLAPTPDRRHTGADGQPLPRPDLAHLIHAALIGYPRYFDPVSKQPCPPEVALYRLTSGTIPHSGLWVRALARLQGRFASLAPLWRK